jgi:hypothetical protein
MPCWGHDNKRWASWAEYFKAVPTGCELERIMTSKSMSKAVLYT